MSDIITGTQAIAAAVKTLTEAGIDDAARDARRLFAFATGIDASRVTLFAGDAMDLAQAAAFADFIKQRARRVPVSHLTGLRAFYDHVFEVGPDVLDPRPETEVLVQAALAHPFMRVLDLGTGSGCILLTLLAAGGAEVFGIGTDLSAQAIAIAHRNAARVGVADRVQFFQGDWFAALPKSQPDFDLIVSNPPYIAASEMLSLAPEVRDFEPRMALTDEGDGLSCYRSIIAGHALHLKRGGRLIVEIGPTQGAAVAQMMVTAGLTQVEVIPDLDARDRVVWGRRPL